MATITDLSENLKRLLSAIIISAAFAVSPANAIDRLDILNLRDTQVQEKLSEVSRMVVLILPSNSSKEIGTGTAATFKDLGQFILTNAHVMKSSTQCAVMVLTPAGKPGFIWGVLIASDSAKDIAILKINRDEGKVMATLKMRGLSGPTQAFEQLNAVYEPGEEKQAMLSRKNAGFGKDLIASEELITPGSQVYFLGFPLGIGASIEMKEPVVRSGLIATRPHSGFFYLDAMVNHGNSGSPVVLFNATADGNVERYGLFLIGIVSGFESDYVDYKADTGDSIRFPHNSGLAKVVSIQAFLDLAKSVH